MKHLKPLLVIGITAVLIMLAPLSNVMAGGGPEPPGDAVISDTKIWGVVTMYCTPAPQDLVILSVKRVVDCNVETQLLVDNTWEFSCPAAGDESAPLDWSLAGITFFDIEGTPYITKVKHFMQDIDGGINATTFEAQFGFWTPAPSP
jgi:hypothetical protein